MPYTDLSAALDALQTLSQKLAAYAHAMGVISLDAQTAAPKGSAQGRGQTLGILSEANYNLIADPENEDLLSYLEANLADLSPVQARAVQLLRRNYQQLTRIPVQEYVDYTILLNDAEDAWVKAKNESNYSLFQPYLEKIVDYNRRFAGYYDPTKAPYDALLNEYERGIDTAQLDRFFGQLKQALIPLIEQVKAADPIDDSFLYRTYPAAAQRLLSDYLMEVLGIDRAYCGIAETEHPFTTNFNNKDVRITTHYYENALASSMYSVIHEGGHAIYELDCDDAYNYTLLAGGASMGIHESQSRFYENIIGRSEAFLSYIFPKVKELFPEQLSDVDANRFWQAVNKSTPSLVRTEADELTYCMHIIIRYELEKQLIDGTLAVADVPAAWNSLYKQYLGVDVPNDKEGCLQDSHWSGGAIGYFPSYALGSAYGAQMLSCMEKDLGNIWPAVALGDLSQIRSWLTEHIHRFACLYEPGDLFRQACGEFDPSFYTTYLQEKYKKLYHLS